MFIITVILHNHHTIYTHGWTAQYITIMSIQYITFAGMSEIDLILHGYTNDLFTRIINEFIKYIINKRNPLLNLRNFSKHKHHCCVTVVTTSMTHCSSVPMTSTSVDNVQPLRSLLMSRINVWEQIQVMTSATHELIKSQWNYHKGHFYLLTFL